VTENKQK